MIIGHARCAAGCGWVASSGSYLYLRTSTCTCSSSISLDDLSIGSGFCQCLQPKPAVSCSYSHGYLYCTVHVNTCILYSYDSEYCFRLVGFPPCVWRNSCGVTGTLHRSATTSRATHTTRKSRPSRRRRNGNSSSVARKEGKKEK